MGIVFAVILACDPCEMRTEEMGHGCFRGCAGDNNKALYSVIIFCTMP